MQKKPRLIRLDSASHGNVRFLSGLHVILEDGKKSSWVTVTRTGTFTDPRYGTFEISRQMLLTMVDNFEKRVYGQDVFIDVAHKPENGAAAKVLRLSVEGDRLRALCEWTPLGLDAIQQKGYRYLSIEYHEHWKDNEAGTDHGPVMLGAGLVVRPAIKRLDPIQLSAPTDDDGIVVLIHPELQTTLLRELNTMHKELLAALLAKLQAKKLAAPVVASLMAAATKAVDHITDKGDAEKMLAEFENSATQLAEQIGDRVVTLSVNMPEGGAGMTADQVRKLMADDRAAIATAAQQQADQTAANVRALTEAIAAADGLDDAAKKALTESATPMVTAGMTADQVKALASMQIQHGKDLTIARQLSGLGYVAPHGSVHIPNISVIGDAPKKLGELYQERLKQTSMYGQGKLRLSEKQTDFVTKVLAQFDYMHGAQISNELKSLSGGSVGMADTNLPVGFRREVIREALSDLRVLELVQTLTDFSAAATTQIPYELRDTSGVFNDGIVYEGQPIHRAGVGQFMDVAYILPMKLAMLISNEVMHFTQNAAINWDAMARNVESNARIMRELICRRIINELQRASDSYGAVAVSAESLTSQFDGASKSTFKTATFPIVRPFQQRDLQGNNVGNPVNPIVVVIAGATIQPYDGTGTQAAGTYYRITNYNLGYGQIVNQAGAPVFPAASGTNTIAYSRATNILKVDLDVPTGSTVEKQLNKLIQGIGSRKAVLSTERFVEPDFMLMSPTLNDMATNAEQFTAQGKRNGADTSQGGDLESIKGMPAYGTNAPGVDIGGERILVGQRGLLGYVVAKPFVTGQPFEAVNAQGVPIGKKQAYGEEYSAIKVPTPVASRMTSVIAYSFTNR